MPSPLRAADCAAAQAPFAVHLFMLQHRTGDWGKGTDSAGVDTHRMTDWDATIVDVGRHRITTLFAGLCTVSAV